jgi:hypothetical protein
MSETRVRVENGKVKIWEDMKMISKEIDTKFGFYQADNEFDFDDPEKVYE